MQCAQAEKDTVLVKVKISCSEICRTSTFAMNFCHLMPSSLCKHCWSRVSVLNASTSVIARHSELYSRKYTCCTVLHSLLCGVHLGKHTAYHSTSQPREVFSPSCTVNYTICSTCVDDSYMMLHGDVIVFSWLASNVSWSLLPVT